MLLAQGIPIGYGNPKILKMVQQVTHFTEVVDFRNRYKLKWTRRRHFTPIVDLFIFSKFKAILGGRMQTMLSGGAPLAADSHNFCRTCLGITLFQVALPIYLVMCSNLVLPLELDLTFDFRVMVC